MLKAAVFSLPKHNVINQNLHSVYVRLADLTRGVALVPLLVRARRYTSNATPSSSPPSLPPLPCPVPPPAAAPPAPPPPLPLPAEAQSRGRPPSGVSAVNAGTAAATVTSGAALPPPSLAPETREPDDVLRALLCFGLGPLALALTRGGTCTPSRAPFAVGVADDPERRFSRA